LKVTVINYLRFFTETHAELLQSVPALPDAVDGFLKNIQTGKIVYEKRKSYD